jgi:hypothetical protein
MLVYGIYVHKKNPSLEDSRRDNVHIYSKKKKVIGRTVGLRVRQAQQGHFDVVIPEVILPTQN